MLLDRHVTLRCLTDDLTAGWETADHYRAVKILRTSVGRVLKNELPESSVAAQLRNLPRLNALDHPLLRHFESAFGPDEDPSSRESISGLTAPHWWKQKTMRWRGAATDHSIVGSGAVWLCAAGIRRQGDGDDFYNSFTRNVSRAGPEPWLPSAEDRMVAKIDEKVLALDAWKLQIHCCALALLAEATDSPGETSTVEFPAPSRGRSANAVGRLTLSVESVDIDGVNLDEVFLTVTILNREQVKAVDVAAQIARAALQSDAQEWHSTVYSDEAYAFSALLDPSAKRHAEALGRTGDLAAESVPGHLRLGLRAHYARKHGLVDAQVEGSSVLSLCGYWFVPTKDHETLETCDECARQHEHMPAS